MSSLDSTLKLAKKAQYALQSNAGLDSAEAQKEFTTFIKQVTRVIRTQVKRVIEQDKLIDDMLFLLGKEEANTNLLSYLSSKWVTLTTVFSETYKEDVVDNFYMWAANEGGQNAMDRMGIDVSFVLRNDAVTQWLSQRENLMINSVDDTTKDKIVRLIQQAREEQLTNHQLKELIQSKFSEMTPARAEAIARTELAEAFNRVEFEAYKRNGVQRIRWVTVQDERVCPICAPLHNTEVPIGQEFPGAGGHPPAHVNCRCFIEEVMAGFAVRGNAIVWAGE